MDTEPSRPADRDLLEALDHAIPHPHGPGAGPAVRRGRRALLRRRAAVAAGGLAVATVVALAVGPLDVVGGRADRTAAGDTGPAASTASTVTSGWAVGGPAVGPARIVVRTDVEAREDADLTTADLTLQGDLVVPPGTRVLGVVEEPLGYRAPSHSLAVEYEQPGLPGVQRAFLEVRPDLVAGGTVPPGYEEDGRGGVVEPAAASPHLDLRAWVFVRVAFGSTAAWPWSGLADEPVIDLTTADTVVPDDGSQLVDQVADPLRLAAPARSLAVAWRGPARGAAAADGETEQWAVVVVDPTWRPGPGATAVDGMLNGYAIQRQAPVPGLTFREWAAGLTTDGFVADAPPAWAGTPR